MAHPQTPVSGNANPGYTVPMKDASTQTTERYVFTRKRKRDASTQTVEEYYSQEETPDARMDTLEVDLSFLDQLPTTSETPEESKKRKISNEQEVAHGSDACKLPRTEVCGISTNEDPGYNVLPEHALRTSRDGRTLTAEEFISQETTGDTSMLTPEVDSGFLEQPPTTSETPKESKKRKISNEQEVAHGSDACNLPRTEVCGISSNEDPGYNVLLEHPVRTSRDGKTLTSEEFISQESTGDTSKLTLENELSFLEQPPVASETSEESRKMEILNEQEVTHGSDTCKVPRTETSEMSDQFVSSPSEKVNPDFNNIISATIHTLFKSTRMASIDEEFSNSEERYSQNKDLNAPGSLGNTENLKKEENIASNKNISEQEKTPSEKSDTDVFKVTNVCPDDDMLAEQGPSQCHENNSSSKEFVEIPKTGSSQSQQPPVETEQEEPTCLTCKKTITEHVDVYDGKNMYRCCHRCCRCLFISDNFEGLQMHIFKEHTRPFYCDICQLNYSETSSHDRGGKCDECKQNFDCKYQLEEHYSLVHKDFYETHCRICKIPFEKHNILSNKVLYKCCFKECNLRFDCISTFKQHLSKHSGLKVLKCEVCGFYYKRPFRF